MLGEAEVAEVGVLPLAVDALNQDVRGLDVAVDEAVLVGLVQGARHLRRADRRREPAPAGPPERAARSGRSRHVPHREVQLVLASPKSRIGTTCGWRRPAAIVDSRRKRRRNRSFCAQLGIEELQSDPIGRSLAFGKVDGAGGAFAHQETHSAPRHDRPHRGSPPHRMSLARFAGASAGAADALCTLESSPTRRVNGQRLHPQGRKSWSPEG